MSRAGMSDVAYLIAIGLLLASAVGLLVWGLLQRRRLKRLLAAAQLELTGANNKLSQAKNQTAMLLNADPITGLPIRHVLAERFYDLLKQARHQDTIFGIILIEITNFDRLSDELGKSAGDQLLLAVGDRLTAATRKTDMVGRMQRHEFAVLLSSLQDVSAIDIAESQLRTALLPPFTIQGFEQTFGLTIQFGSASYPRDGKDWTSILKLADHNLGLSRVG